MKNYWRIVFAFYFGFLLAGYAFLDKTFAYVGIGFIYVAEIGILIGVIAFFSMWHHKNLDFGLLKQTPIVILAAFLLWSFSCTIPYIDQYKLYAVRDSSLWWYSVFAFFVLLLIRREWLMFFFKAYGHAIPFFLAWWLLAFFLNWFTDTKTNPFNSAWPVFQIKATDITVHLSGMAAYMLLNISQRAGIKRPAWLTLLIWFAWWVVWLVYGVSSRAAMLGPILGLVILLFLTFRPVKKWGAPVLGGTIMLLLLSLTNIHLKIPDTTRNVEISSDQLVVNFASLMGASAGKKILERAGIEIGPVPPPGEEIAGPTVLRTETIGWRIDWWRKIIDYTVNGRYFWMGKGYGINLADDDGFQVMPDHSLRSPHNVFMTILARSGVPGLVLWCAFLFSVTYALLKSVLKNEQADEKTYAVWLLVYIFASVFNGAFDVYLEGPMGGVWFWSLIGMVYLIFSRKQNPAIGQTQNL